MDNSIIEEYIGKIHLRWLNARDSERPSDFKDGVEWVYCIVENELRKILKEDEDLIKEGVSRIWSNK